MQGGSQNEETKKHVPNERTEQNYRKRTKQNGDKQFTRCRIKNTGYKDAQRTSFYLFFFLLMNIGLFPVWGHHI